MDSPNGSGTATFQATFKTGQAVFELKSQVTGYVSTLTLDVLAPTGTKHKFSRVDPVSGFFTGIDPVSGVATKYVTFHILNRVYISPTNVSFRQIVFWEGEDPKADLSGEFERAAIAYNDPLAPHPSGDPCWVTAPVNAQSGSCWIEEDTLGPFTIKQNGKPGHWIWEIPQQWEDNSMGSVVHEYEVLTQRHDFDGKRTIRTRKGGVDKSGP